MKIRHILPILTILSILLIAAAPLVNSNDFLENSDTENFSALESKVPPCFPNCKVKIKQGEPGMEKISYYYYVNETTLASWAYFNKFDGYYYMGCVKWYYWIDTYKLPMGCNFKYQY
jgi:hypothetical protein